MALRWSEAEVFALTKDNTTLQNGKKLATSAKWSNLGFGDDAVWGECQGSGKDPYRVCIDRTDMGYKCTCPSRKFPCKHTIGLFLLFVNQTDSFSTPTPPNWLTTWINERQKRRDIADRVADTPIDTEAQAKRQEAREDKVRSGMHELRRWLRDLARHGLTDDRLKTYEFWDRMAARMVDAQANSIARRLRSLAGLPFQGRADWATRMLDEISRLYLLSESYERMDALPVETQHDVRALIGWSYKQEELLPLPAVRDRWFVLGQHIEVEERLNMRRVWLHGTRTGRKAMLLDFAHGNVSFEGNYPIGHAFEAELIYYPGAYPQRALLKARRGSMSAALNEFNGFREDMEAALGDYAEALACNPWIDRFPIGLRAVVPFQAEGQCYVRDGVGRCLPVVVQTGNWWIVLSASACHPIPVFGEWDGYDLHLRTVHTDGMYFTI